MSALVRSLARWYQNSVGTELTKYGALLKHHRPAAIPTAVPSEILVVAGSGGIRAWARSPGAGSLLGCRLGSLSTLFAPRTPKLGSKYDVEAVGSRTRSGSSCDHAGVVVLRNQAFDACCPAGLKFDDIRNEWHPDVATAISR